MRGEEIAATHLRNAGMLILDRNWRPHGSEVAGEVDLIARDGDALVIVEVKTRRSLAFGTPVEAVTRRKIRQLRSLGAGVARREVDPRAGVAFRCRRSDHPTGGSAGRRTPTGRMRWRSPMCTER